MKYGGTDMQIALRHLNWALSRSPKEDKMPVRSDEPLRKVTLNLYEADCQWFEKEYGHGWTERLRQHVHKEVIFRTNFNVKVIPPTRRTIGDLTDD